MFQISYFRHFQSEDCDGNPKYSNDEPQTIQGETVEEVMEKVKRFVIEDDPTIIDLRNKISFIQNGYHAETQTFYSFADEIVEIASVTPFVRPNLEDSPDYQTKVKALREVLATFTAREKERELKKKREQLERLKRELGE